MPSNVEQSPAVSEFYIVPEVLGTERGLLCDDTGMVWCDEPPLGVLRWGMTLDTDSSDCLNVSLKLAGYDVKWRFEPRYIEAMCSVMPSYRFNRSVTIPWHLIAPPKYAASAVKHLVDDIRRAVADSDPAAYATFNKQTAFFQALQPARIDVEKLARYSETGNRASFLEAFKPGPDGFASAVKYNRLQTEEDGGTKTGRLKIVSGPPFMTLNKEYRDIITSRYDGGEVWYVDYSSLEPRTFQAYLGRKLPKDFYTTLARDILGDSGKTPSAKAMFLSRFYGAGIDTMVEAGTIIDGDDRIEPSHDQARKLAKHVDEDFGVKEMTAKLVAEASATGRIRNKFGMTIPVEKGSAPNVLFNNFVQSTANAVALLGFAKMCRGIEKAGLEMVPICAIHDAMILDVHPAARKYVRTLMKVGSRIPELGDCELPMHAERIS